MIQIKGFYHLFDNKELEDPQIMEAIVLLMEEHNEDFLLNVKKSLNDLFVDNTTLIPHAIQCGFQIMKKNQKIRKLCNSILFCLNFYDLIVGELRLHILD